MCVGPRLLAVSYVIRVYNCLLINLVAFS